MKADNRKDWMPTRTEATACILANSVFAAPPSQRVPLDEALGRYLASPCHARYDVPNTRTANRDGIAFRYDDFVAANGDFSTWKECREYVFANTGIAIPEDFDTTLRIEDVEFENGKLLLGASPAGKYDMTSEQGSRLKKGALLVSAWQRLAPAHLGLLAAGGYHDVLVVKKPDVAIIPSGNELVPPTLFLPRGRNLESNSALLSAKVRSWGGVPHVSRIIPDDLSQLSEALSQAAAENDIVVFNAGSSKGTDDFALPALESTGKLFFHRVSYGPGHHTAFAMVDTTPVLGLVGPPIGADFNADFYLRPLMEAYYQQSYKAPPLVRARLLQDHTSFPQVQGYARGLLTQGSGGPEVSLLGMDDFIAAYVQANCYVLFDRGGNTVPAGSIVDVELREPWEPELFLGSCL